MIHTSLSYISLIELTDTSTMSNLFKFNQNIGSGHKIQNYNQWKIAKKCVVNESYNYKTKLQNIILSEHTCDASKGFKLLYEKDWIPRNQANKNSKISRNKLNSRFEILPCLKLTESAGYCELFFLCFLCSRLEIFTFKRQVFSHLFSFSIAQFIDESLRFYDLEMSWNIFVS